MDIFSEGHYSCIYGIDWVKYNLFIENVQDRFLEFTPEQHPIALQIGGNNLENIAKATQLANAYGYDEINLKLVLRT